MTRVSIDLTEKEIKVLKSRAKKNLMTFKEQIEDIVRRSCVSYSKNKSKRPLKVDDKLVGIFSRQKSGRKKKK